MSSPYLLMMLNPAWVMYLPRPGIWMVKLKEGMGFVLLVTVVWLLSILARQVGIDAVMAITYFLITVTFAAWLASRFVDLTSSVTRATILRASAVAIVLAAAYVFIFTKPALLITTSNNSVVNATPSTSAESLAWQPFAIDKLESSVNAGKTVLVDCTASWCLTCQVNESTVLNNQAVVERLKKMNVVLLKADWTNQDLAITQFLRKFGRSGVPMYVIFPAKSPANPILLPEIITVPLVLQKLEEAS
jgi:thiol:disulfide interchange protein